MREQHLSDEAVAAFADGVLAGHARERARRHCAECGECAQAVTAQREAVWLLRAAPAPSLPSGLFDRLVQVPATTEIKTLPTALAEDGTTMFASFGTAITGAMTAAAIVPNPSPPRRHVHPLVATTAAVAAAGVLTVASASTSAGARSVTPVESRVADTQSQLDSVSLDSFLPERQPARAR